MLTVASYFGEQFTSLPKLHDEVELCLVLQHFVKPDQVGVVASIHHFYLTQQHFRGFAVQFRFVDHFHTNSFYNNNVKMLISGNSNLILKCHVR